MRSSERFARSEQIDSLSHAPRQLDALQSRLEINSMPHYSPNIRKAGRTMCGPLSNIG